MPLIVPPGYGSAAFTFSGTAGTPEFITTIGVDMSDFTDDYVAAANLLFSIYAETWLLQTSNLLTLSKVSLTVGSDGGGGSIESSIGGIPGSISAPAEALAMAPIIRKSTAELGRKGRGRMFIPGVLMAVDVNIGGFIDGSRMTLYRAAALAFYEMLTTDGARIDLAASAEYTGKYLPPVLLHSDTTPPSPITGLSPSNMVGWIRGRIR